MTTESPNRHIRAQLEQALKVRGSFDFNCRADYEAFVQTVVNRRNKRIATQFKDEQRQLHALPAHKSGNYSLEYVRVSRTSTTAPALGKAMRYFIKHDEGLSFFCRIENAKLDNNTIEAKLKIVVRDRKT